MGFLQRHGRFVVVVLGLLLLIAIAPGMASCSSSSGGAGISANCSINSDCNSPLICAFARCHGRLRRVARLPRRRALHPLGHDRQLPVAPGGHLQQHPLLHWPGVRDRQAVPRRVHADVGGGAASMLPSGTADGCYSPTNANDEPALIAAHILGADGAVTGDGSVGTGPAADGAISPESGSIDGAPVDGAGPRARWATRARARRRSSATRPSATSNPNFTSGVGARTAQQLLVFDSYVGPDPAGDGGGPNIGLTYVQAFDPANGMSAAPAQPLFQL